MRYTNFNNSQNRKANDRLEREDKKAGSPNPSSNANQNSSEGSNTNAPAKSTPAANTPTAEEFDSEPEENNPTAEQPKPKAAAPKYAGLAGGLKDQLKKEARVVGKLPNDFPVDQWESLNTKQQRQALKFSGLDDQEQWVLLNANAPLRVLDEYNQEQLASGISALATKVASASAKASSPRNPASDSLRSISTPLQKAALQRKLELQREALAERERQAQGRTSVRATLDDGASNRPAANTPVARDSQSSKSGEDDGGEKNIFEKFKTLFRNLVNFFTQEETPEPASITPQVVTMVTVPPTASPKSMEEKKDARWDKIEQYTNGNVRETLYDWSKIKDSGNMEPFPVPAPVPVLKDIPYPENGEKACVFFTNSRGAAFGRQARYQQKVLESMGYDVELVQTDDVDAFQTEWNNMDPKTTTAVIISHCNGMSLIFEDNSSDNAMSANGKNISGEIIPDIRNLSGPEIAELYIYACNAGVEELLAFAGTNVADAFRDLSNVDTVYAFDGSVGFGPPSIFRTSFEPRLSVEQNYDDVFSNFNIPEAFGKSGTSGLLRYSSGE